ncbi:DoxX family protein [Streptomyces sp. NPDC001436]
MADTGVRVTPLGPARSPPGATGLEGISREGRRQGLPGREVLAGPAGAGSGCGARRPPGAFLIGAQIAGAAGVIAGLWWGPVGIAAAIGLTLYFAGAVAFHLRVGDRKDASPAVVLTMASVALIVLHAATL